MQYGNFDKISQLGTSLPFVLGDLCFPVCEGILEVGLGQYRLKDLLK